MNIEEVQEPETTKIYRQNPLPSVADTRKLRKFTDETNMQARNHENSDEICAQPVRHLDLATPAFYHYRKNPKCYHTVWGIKSDIKRCSKQAIRTNPPFTTFRPPDGKASGPQTHPQKPASFNWWMRHDHKNYPPWN